MIYPIIPYSESESESQNEAYKHGILDKVSAEKIRRKLEKEKLRAKEREIRILEGNYYANRVTQLVKLVEFGMLEIPVRISMLIWPFLVQPSACFSPTSASIGPDK